MKNSFHNIISILLIPCILGVYFYEYPDKDKIDFKKQIVDFTRYEDERNLDKVLSYFQFPLQEYWQHKDVSKNELKKLYQGYWKRYEYSKNDIQKIDKVDNYEFVLTTKYIYSKYIKNLNRYRLSETKFKLNKSGKITSITNLSIKKIDHQYILDNNLIRNFSYTEKIFKKNNPDLAIVLTIFLLFNIIVQIFITNSTSSKSIKESTANVNNSNKKASKQLSNQNLRDQSINELKLKEQIAADKLNKRVKEEKNSLKEKAHKEFLIKTEKARIASEKQLAAKKEAERIRKIKIAKEKRKERERLEKERIIAVQKANAEAKRRREEEAREKRKKEEEEARRINESNIALVEEDEDDFFDDNLSQYITEIPDDEETNLDEDEIGDFLTEKYMSKNLKNKLKKR